MTLHVELLRDYGRIIDTTSYRVCGVLPDTPSFEKYENSSCGIGTVVVR
jgi:hypothetical protein